MVFRMVRATSVWLSLYGYLSCLCMVISVCLAVGVFSKKTQLSWDSSNTYLKDLLVDLTKNGWGKNVFMNINFPYCSADLVESIQITTQGNRESDDLIIREVEKSKFRFGLRRRLEDNAKLTIAPINEVIEGYMSDVEAIANKHISVTPLHLDLTHHKSLEVLKKGLKLNLN